jgi:hypothetical protein
MGYRRGSFALMLPLDVVRHGISYSGHTYMMMTYEKLDRIEAL